MNTIGVARAGRSSLRKPGRRDGSIREVRLIGLEGPAAGVGWEAGDRLGWWGRSYRVASSEPGESPSSGRYLHLTPADQPEN